MSTHSIRISYLISPDPIKPPHQENYEFGLTTTHTKAEEPPAELPTMQIPFHQFLANTPLNKMTAERDHLKARMEQLEQENATLQQTVQELTFRLNRLPPADRHLTQQEYVNASQNRRLFHGSTYQPEEIPPHPEMASRGVPPSHYIVSKQEVDHAIAILKTNRGDRYNEVVYHADLAIKANPQNAEAYACKSEVLRLMEKWLPSYESAEYALAIDSENVSALINIGIVLNHFGDYRKSLFLTNKLLQIQPHNLFGLKNKIGNLYCLQMLNEASDTLTFAMQSHPNDYELVMFQKRLMEEFIHFRN